jgi:hypothetical protein
MKTSVSFAIAMLLFAPSPQERPIQNEDARSKAINEEIANTTPEGKEIIERVKRMLPEINSKLSTLPLEKLVEKFEKEKNVTPVGWAAARKRISGRWKILFYYQDETKEYKTAEWEYNPDKVLLYPFEFNNAPQFGLDPRRVNRMNGGQIKAEATR